MLPNETIATTAVVLPVLAEISETSVPTGSEPIVYNPQVTYSELVTLIDPGLPTGLEPVVYNDIQPSIDRTVQVGTGGSFVLGPVLQNGPVDVSLTEVTPTGNEPIVFNDGQTGVIIPNIVEPGVPDGTQPIVYNGSQTAITDISLVQPHAPDGTEPVVYNDGGTGLVIADIVEPGIPDGTQPIVYNGSQTAITDITIIQPHAPDGTEPVVYNDGQTGIASIIDPGLPTGHEPIVYNDGRAGAVDVWLSDGGLPTGNEPIVYGHVETVGQTIQAVDTWLDQADGHAWFNLTNPAQPSAAAQANSIKLTLSDLLALPTDRGTVHVAQITGDTNDTVNMSNLFDAGSAGHGHWEVQGSVVQNGVDYTAYYFTGNAQLQVLVDNHIQHVNLA